MHMLLQMPNIIVEKQKKTYNRQSRVDCCSTKSLFAFFLDLDMVVP